MDRMRSDNLDNLLLALSKLEYRDFVGVKPELAKSLRKLIKTLDAILEYEISVRDVQTFMPFKHNPHRSSDGAFM